MFNIKGCFSGELFRGLVMRAPSFGVIQFVLLTLLAAMFYPGGFDIYGQYFSELGATMARNGGLNSVSSSLFLVANLVIAVTLVPFWLEIPSLLNDTRGMKAAGKLGSALGLISSPFMMGTAFCPIDTQPGMHFLMFLIFFPLFNMASLLYSIAIMLDQRVDEKPGVLGLLLFALSILVFIDPSASYAPLLQKGILYGYFIWVLTLNELFFKETIGPIHFHKKGSSERRAWVQIPSPALPDK
jgi:hypothetical membrane protein